MIPRGFLALCYHYIRPLRADDPDPDLLGSRIDVFRTHIRVLSEQYTPISLRDVFSFLYGAEVNWAREYGILLTFDDGLSDHYRAGTMLAEYGIPATFFIPTCTLLDGEPANPTIIHYTLARYRIRGFLRAYHEALEALRFDVDAYRIVHERGADPWVTIQAIKRKLHYDMPYRNARRVLLSIYKELLQRDDPNILSAMHLSTPQVRELLSMGHMIGVHTHTHVSVGAARLVPEDVAREILTPRRYLEDTFRVRVDALSYPFGGHQDCLSTQDLIRRTDAYALAFTIGEIMNTAGTSPFELGRYMPTSTETAKDLLVKLDAIAAREPIPV